MTSALYAAALAKRAFRPILGGQPLGMLDYIRFPERGAAWGGPFNGQPARQALFGELVARVRPCVIVETGTYLGTTTEFFAEFGKPVFTVEGDPRACGFARARLWKRRNVTLVHDDSRQALRRWFEGPLRTCADKTSLFYLDAHWNAELPLAQELAIIFSHCRAAVVMIDDFQVPFDAGYAFDDYGAGKALTFRYIAPAMSTHGLRAFYPSTPSAHESGACRGCVVLAKRSSHISVLSALPLLCGDTVPL